MKLEPKLSTTERKALKDLRGPDPPPGVSQRLWGKSHPRPNQEGLAWHRGHQAGLQSAALTIEQKYPRVARELREALGMDSDGNIAL